MNYTGGYRTLSQISVWEFYYFSTPLWKKTCQYKKVVLQWACTGQDHPPGAQPYLCFITQAKKWQPQRSPLIVQAEFTERRQSNTFFSLCVLHALNTFLLNHWHLFCLNLSSQPRKSMPCIHIEKHSNVFIHSLNKLTNQVTATKSKHMMAKFRKK